MVVFVVVVATAVATAVAKVVTVPVRIDGGGPDRERPLADVDVLVGLVLLVFVSAEGEARQGVRSSPARRSSRLS